MRAAQTPTTATLRPDKENSKDWDTTKNVFIEGDNLEVLKILQKHYHGKIKMIYIDPPYNTGKDFVYPDNYKEGLETYLEWSKQVNEDGKKLSSNAETEGRYHSNWLNMMYPRLKLARNLLTDDGVIFISIDENEFSNLKKICDEIFGESNFQGTIVRRTATDNNPTTVAVEHEYVLAYARNSSMVGQWAAPSENGAHIQRKYEELKESFGNKHEEIRKELRKWISEKLKSGDLALDGVSHYSYIDDRGVYYPGNSANTKPGNYHYDIIHPETGLPTAKPANGWRWPKSTFEAASRAGEVHWGRDHTTVPKIKKRLSTATSLLKSVYYEDNRASTAAVNGLLGGDKVFDNPKSVNFLKRLAMFTTSENDIILDFFSGSGSTAHAVMELNAEDGGNRQHIQVQLPEPTTENSQARKLGFCSISEISRHRIDAAGLKILEETTCEEKDSDSQLDTGFRAYSLADTTFTKWRTDSDIDATQLEQHLLDLRESADDNATPDDLLTEILLKQGHSLVEQIRDHEFDGLSYKAVVRVDDEDGEEDTLVLAYLDEHTKPTLAQLRAALEVKPAQFIMLEDAFQGDDQLKTNLAQICKTNGIELWTA